jgi:hypothetical protein
LFERPSVKNWKCQAGREFYIMKMLRVVSLLVAIAVRGTLAPLGRAQSSIVPGASSSIVGESPFPTTKLPLVDSTYRKPPEKTRFRTYLFDAFGPYPIAGAALIAAVNQSERTPPEWGQGASAYGQRFGSNLAIAAVTTTTRYGLAKAFKEDTVYYRCECKGILQRFRHAMISTVTPRRGEDGHRRLSFPAIVAPFAGTMTAVYAWYPRRYGAKDALRMGNYTLLAFAGENLALEFIYGGPHTLFSHLHRPAFSGTDAGCGPDPRARQC